MINFRRKIGIILVVAVSAAAILAVPASAAPKQASFDYNCEGTVVLEPSISDERVPASNYSCTRDFTLKTPRLVMVEFLPSDNFTGTMGVEISSNTASQWQYFWMMSDFVAGQPVQRKIGYFTLPAGSWRLTALHQVATINPYVVTGEHSYVAIPASAGGYGGRVVSI